VRVHEEKPSFRSTLVWVLGTAVAVCAATTVLGVRFVLSHENEIAQTILDQHVGAVLWTYLRILLGYVAAGLVAALLLHPLARGWKAAPLALLLCALGLVHTLTDGTHLLHGPTQTHFSSVRDALPAWIRALYRPWMIEALFALLVLAALYRWTRAVPWKWKLGALAVAALGVALGFRTVAKAAPQGPTCFLLIATDSLRADHLGCNGYERPTSPHIDALAARGTNFATCLVPTASTHESWIALLSSTEPRVNGLRHMFPSRAKVAQIEREQVFFPRLLAKRGYRTGAIGGWCGTTLGIFDLGFEHVDVSDTQNHRALIAEALFTNHLLATAFLDNPVGRLLVPELGRVSFTRNSPALTRRAKAFLADAVRDDAPFFLTVVYHVNHLPYSASYPHYARFTDPGYRGRNRYRIDFRIDDMIQRGFDHDLTATETQHIIDLYDGCVREFDAQVGELVACVAELGLADRTIVGVWADHGDDLYEHGTTLGHGVTLFGGDQANHPPAIFAGPGVPRRRVEELVRSYDLAPTWARWLGLKRPERWQGVDLSRDVPELTALLETSYLLYRQPVPDLGPGEKVKRFPKTMDRATFLDPEFDFNPVLRPELEDDVVATKCFAVREGRWKLIRVPGETGPILRLFDLEQDPQCRHDLAGVHGDVLARLLRQLPEQAR
jgi:arylsulfatase A-like enzyme